MDTSPMDRAIGPRDTSSGDELSQDEATARVPEGAPMLLRVDGGEWAVPSTTTWDQESSLRDIVAENPTLIPGVTDPGTRAVTELPIRGAGYADVVAVDSSGRITICEVKLARNPEIRRAVIGQVLAYAAGLASTDVLDFDRAWSARDKGRGLLDDADDAFQEALAGSLTTGRFRLVLVVDGLTEELRSIIGYLAQQTVSGFELVALEVEYARQGDTEVLVPRSFGAELGSTKPRRRAGGTSGIQLDITDENIAVIVDGAEAVAAGAGAVVNELIEHMRPALSHLYLGRSDSTDAVLSVREPYSQPFKVVNSQRTPGVRICFDWMTRFGTDSLDALLTEIETQHELAPHVADVREASFRKRPLIPYTVLTERPDLVYLLVDAVARARPGATT